MKQIASCLAVLLAGCASEADVGMPPQNAGNFAMTEYEEVGDGWLRASAGVLVDKETHCEYIVLGYKDVSVTPRLGRDGQPKCNHNQGADQ